MNYSNLYMKRTFDVFLSLIALVITFPLFLLVAVLVKISSAGPILNWSDRVGRDNDIFKMPKFRTMHLGAPVVATHLLTNAERFFTPVGKFLRNSSLDELPQLFSILKGDMSIVGPRPALFNQEDLVKLRTAKGVHVLTPGLTGWAQINGRDELSIPEKVEFDAYYLQHRSFALDVKIIYKTVYNVVKCEGVSQ